MTFDKTNLKVGTVFYSVEETNHIWIRKKIHRVIDGENWFKYTEPNRSYYLKEYLILGIMRKTLEGRWDKSELSQMDDDYYVQVTTPTDISLYTTQFDPDDVVEFFIDKDEAALYIKMLEEKAFELEK